jgi:transcriptional antiterminator RfaH
MSEAGSALWYVVQTHVNGETKAALNLQRQGYEVYLPRYLKRRNHARKIDFAVKPLFPRYMFVAIEMATQGWRSIQSTVGVSRLVCQGDVPSVVPRGVVPALKEREDDRGFISMDVRPAFAPGDKVRVLAGAFMDNAGLFNGLADHNRVSILLDLLGRKVRVLLDADMVAAA